MMGALSAAPIDPEEQYAQQLAAMERRIAELERSFGRLSGARGFLATGNSGTKTTVGTTPLTLITTSTFAIAANRRTRWTLGMTGFGNTLGDIFDIKIFSAGGGTLIYTAHIEVTGAGRYMMPPLSMVGFDTPVSSVSTTYVATITQITGSGTFTMSNTATFNNHLTVEDVGP